MSRDGHIEVAKSYYSVPTEYLAREVWVRWDARLVRIFNHRFEPIAVHARHEQGRFSTNPQHIAQEKINGLERGVAYLLKKVSAIGQRSHEWSQAMIHARGIQGTRVLQGLLALTKKHTGEALEKACEIALSHGSYRLQTIRNLAVRHGDAKQEALPFLDEHPIIRPLSDYGAIVHKALARQAIHRPDDRSSVSEGFTRHGESVRRADEKGLGHPVGDRGLDTSSTRSRSGYPLPGRSSAEPGSVSPDDSTIVPSDSSSTTNQSITPLEFPHE